MVTGAGGTAGATGAMAKRQGLSRASGRAGEKEGPTPGKSTKPTPRAGLQAGGLNIVGRVLPLGAPYAWRCRRNSRPQRMPPGHFTLVPHCPRHKGKMA